MALKIVSISGLDGSGKSTQARMLIDSLTNKGVRVCYFHAIHFSIAQKLLNKPPSSDSQETGVIKASLLQILLRKIALRIDLIRFRVHAKQLEHQGVEVLISDRYFFDTVVNIAYLEKSDALGHYTIPKPMVAFCLMANPNNIMSRRRVPEQGKKYLEKKSELYRKAVAKYGITVVNAELNPLEVHNILMNKLKSVM